MLQRAWVPLALLLCACPGRLQNPDRFLTDAGSAGCMLDVESGIFKPRCALAGCHDAATMQNGLDLATAGISTRLKAATGSAACGSKALVPLMQEKVHPSPSCGTRMPQGAPLSADELACVDEYLADLADGGT